MPKQKTRKAAAKRFKITGSGKILRERSFKRHLLESKSQGKKRSLRKSASVSPSDYRRIKRALPGI